MHIAQIAPLTEAIPPKLYGGTERVVSWLTEELIALGHEVTLFASGDSVTSAQLEAAWPRALRLDGSVRDPNALHMMMLERVYQRVGRFRFPALPPRLLSVLAVFPPGDALRDHVAWPARSARTPAGVRGVFAISRWSRSPTSQRRPLPQANWVRTVHHGLPEKLLDAEAGQAVLFRLPRPHRAGKGHRSRHPDRPALRHAAQNRGEGRQRRPRIFRRADPAADQIGRRRIYRRDQRQREVGILERRHRAARSDRLAGAVRAGDDRSDGLRHAGDRVQSRLGSRK